MAGRANQSAVRALVAAMLVGAAACGTDADPQATPEPSTSDAAQPTDGPPPVTSDPVTAAVLAEPYRSVADASVELELMLTAQSAVDLVFQPADEALHVVEHAGRVLRVVDDETDVVADLTARLADHADEQGLTGLEFSADGRIAWMHYTLPNGTTTVSEVAVGNDGDFDLGSERVLFELDNPPGFNHNAGDLLLAADGTLLITLGDGDAAARDGADGIDIAADDPHRVAHDPTTLRGSILRVRPTPDQPAPYEIPADNPFADGPLITPDGQTVNGAPEVLAWGLRNPWKINIDVATGALWIADVGSEAHDEINVVVPEDGRPAGWAADFGWSGFEGTETRNDDVEAVFDEPIEPAFAYEHDGVRCAISGGAVYRGDAIPELWSGYVYADFCGGSVWVFDSTTGDERLLASGIPGISSVRTGPHGELFVSSWFGEVYRVVRAG